MNKEYTIKHKIKGYTGKSACVFFIDGICKTNDRWIAAWFERRGHTVEININDTDIDTDEFIYSDDINESPLDYSKLKLDELKDIAKSRNIEGYESMKKSKLIELLEGDFDD